jgi:hypothetical protein
MTDIPVYVFVATYDSADHAADDFAGVQRLQRDGVLATFDGAVMARDAEGSLSPRTEYNTATAGAWFGRTGGAFIDQLRDSMPAEDWQEIAEQLDGSPAAVIVIGEPKLAAPLGVALARARSWTQKRLTSSTEHTPGQQLRAVGAAV